MYVRYTIQDDVIKPIMSFGLLTLEGDGFAITLWIGQSIVDNHSHSPLVNSSPLNATLNDLNERFRNYYRALS